MINVVVLAFATLVSACASAPAPAAHDSFAAGDTAELRSLDEGEAVALIERLLREARLRPVSGWHVALPKRGALDVDLRLGDSAFGIEWVSAHDRSRYGDVLPAPDPGGQLRLLSSPDGGQARILVLDHETYRLPARDRSRTAELHAPASRGEYERDLEQRLRRDLTDFIEYARSQYRL